MSCVDAYRKKLITNFHKFQCSCCRNIKCALCSKSILDHIGETLICPRAKPIRTAEEIVEARTNGIRYCPMCDIATKHDGGCDHMKCENCSEHWCFACEKHLPVNAITGTRYDHVCTETPIGHNAWRHEAEPLPVQWRMLEEVNPAQLHKIAKV
jgi:hypothetical protein